MRVEFVVVLLAAIGGTACGDDHGLSPSQPTGPSAPSGPTITASGQNWSFRLDGFPGAPTKTISPGGLIIIPTYGTIVPLLALEGAFNPADGSVSAVLQPYGRCFTNWDTNRVRFTGTRSGNAIALESQPDEGQVVRINLTLSDDGSAALGTYSISGGCAGGTGGSIDGRLVNLAGVWTGQMGSIPLRVDMQMADTPNANGTFTISGATTFTGTACFANASITRNARGRILFPDIESASHRMELIGEVWGDLTAMKVTYGLVQGTCPELLGGNSTLTRQ